MQRLSSAWERRFWELALGDTNDRRHTMADIGGQDTEAAEGSTLDDASIAQVSEAAKRLRDTATWTVGAVAALGTTVGGAITFTGLEDLDGWRLTLGAAGLVTVVFAAAIVILFVARVLAPTNIPLREADKELHKAGAGGLMKDMLLGASHVDGFADALNAAEGALVTALGPRPAGQPRGAEEIARARSVAALYGARAERIRMIAHFSALRGRWKRAQWAIAVAVAMVAAGVVGYEVAASDQRVADDEMPKIAGAPDRIATFTAGALGVGVEPGCAKRRRSVEVPGQAKGRKALLLRPKGSCPGLFVRVASTQVKTELPPTRAAKPRPKPRTGRRS